MPRATTPGRGSSRRGGAGPRLAPSIIFERSRVGGPETRRPAGLDCRAGLKAAARPCLCLVARALPPCGGKLNRNAGAIVRVASAGLTSVSERRSSIAEPGHRMATVAAGKCAGPVQRLEVVLDQPADLPVPRVGTRADGCALLRTHADILCPVAMSECRSSTFAPVLPNAFGRGPRWGSGVVALPWRPGGLIPVSAFGHRRRMARNPHHARAEGDGRGQHISPHTQRPARTGVEANAAARTGVEALRRKSAAVGGEVIA